MFIGSCQSEPHLELGMEFIPPKPQAEKGVKSRTPEEKWVLRKSGMFLPKEGWINVRCTTTDASIRR